ncbi:MAG: DNA polymerase I [Christensenellales bacterium]|jgi:DNA polymerase-1
MSEQMIVIDGHSLMHRAFYALPDTMTNEAGLHTNAIYGFLMMLQRIIRDEDPAYLAVAFDPHGPTFRHEAFAQYKGSRKKMPDELREQFDPLQEILRAWGIPVIVVPGYEADDVLGTCAAWCRERGRPMLVVTGDKDTLQLISPSTQVLLTRRGITDTARMDADALMQMWGVSPEHVPDLKGLMGDSSDNIPGVPGVGEKTARKLMDQFGDLEGVLTHVDQVSGKKLQATLREYADQARMSRDLATIRTDAPMDFAQLQIPLPAPPADKLEPLFARLAFKDMMDKLAARPSAPPAEPDPAPQDEVLVEDAAGAAHLARSLAGQPVALYVDDAWHISDGQTQWQAPLSATEALAPLLTDPNTPKTVHDAKDASRRLSGGATLQGVAEDTLLSAYLLHPNAGKHELPALLSAQGLSGAAGLMALGRRQAEQVRQAGMDALYRQVEMPLWRVLLSMERLGFLVDTGMLAELQTDFDKHISALAEEIYALAGSRFNILSPKQLGQVLFVDLGLPPAKRTKTGFSTDAEVLENLAPAHPVVEKILLYRQMTKLKGTYLDGLLAVADPDTRRVHSLFHQAVTATGRISSSEPNLQNIPVRTDMGREIRKAFVAGPGNLLVDADYSQIELRVLAHMSGDARMIEAFTLGQDIHQRTAAEVFGVPLDEVSAHQRSAAKAVNFGIVYGISDFGLARNIGIGRGEAADFIARYFARYPGVKDFMDRMVEQGKALGYAETLLGRRRPLPELNSRNYNTRSFGERVAMNMPIQGTAADLIKMAMNAVYQRLEAGGLRARLMLQVHDELIVQCPEDEAERVSELLKQTMEQVMILKAPLVAEVSTGRSWYEAK